MDLTLKRTAYNSWGITGVLIDSDGIQIAVTLEHAYASPDGSYLPKLNFGTHKCVLGPHQLKSGPIRQLYEILDVPGHKGVLFHNGDYNQDSEGCVLLGDALGDKMILASVDALTRFMSIQGGKDFNLTVA